MSKITLKYNVYSTVILFNLKMAVRSLTAHKTRVFLTLLCIAIGVASIVIMQAIGTETKHHIVNMVSSMGSNIISVKYKGQENGAFDSHDNYLTQEDITSLSSHPHISHSTLFYTAPGAIVSPQGSADVQLIGANADIAIIRNLVIDRGRFYTPQEDAALANVVVLGASLAERLFPQKETVFEQHIKINDISMQVIGILTQKGEGMDAGVDDAAFLPSNSYLVRLFGHTPPSGMVLKAKDASHIEPVKYAVEQRLSRFKHQQNYEIRNTTELLKTLHETQSKINLFLLSISSVTLFVAGVSVMNTILISVRERRREIGIRLAVGASYSDIFYQFLTEAFLISLLGALLGLLFSFIGFRILLLFDIAVGFSFYSFLLASLAACFITVVFGVYPSHRAAASAPIEGIREL
ncbi:FtsX-like permease family protein [Photorhabdus noenieputensis]|uniref:ABC transporter permease n=1 Tax=Photorhabdus noenieputensis TaxID=1208607 RepID=UPI001BD21FCE|nr:ABC transporter permease [Photorhabdus noenieputensis]MBS9437409.1 FtsX-like permease family protein [Photorhabdus noenieputensis]MCK3670034.1 ABC transporter permease [Photorhabdus noenieputensis]